jgi:hypothetical protein
MADTPYKPFPAIKGAKAPFARIDPEGNVVATWRTWALLAGAIVWLTLTYARVDSAATRVAELAVDVQINREALIQAGLLSPVYKPVKPPRGP